MFLIHLWAVMATLLAWVIAQTPPGFTPRCSKNLGVTYKNGLAIHPGSLFQTSGMSSYDS